MTAEPPSVSDVELDTLIKSEGKKVLEIDAAKKVIGHIDFPTAIQRRLNGKGNRDILRRALGVDGLRQWDEEPHLRVMLLKGVSAPVNSICDCMDSFMRLNSGAKEQPYIRTQYSLDSTVHVGQRKLLINELLFMNLHSNKSTVVVYIGAAGGQHIPALCELFPAHQFLLYDPSPFSKPLLDYKRKNPGRITIYNELFPPAAGSRSRIELEAVTRGDNGFLLISDIRRKDQDAEAPTNTDVDEDMELQFAMCREMNPKAAHLKFRLPYLEPDSPDIEVKVLKGPIYFQPWCAHKSTETRLIIEPPYDDTNLITLSARSYESALYYHNSVTRYTRFIVPQLAVLDLFVGTVYDLCFDCTFERYTILQYLNSGKAVSGYKTFAEIYTLFKHVIGREDERLLR